MSTVVIYNPVCGNNTAEDVVNTQVLPLLNSAGKETTVVKTESVGHAGKIVVDLLASVSGQLSVVLCSGDGTLHEIINTVSTSIPQGENPVRLHIALVPCGTANALYSSFFPPPVEETPAYKLQSLQSFLDGGRERPLTLSITTLSSPYHLRQAPKVMISAVVTSTCLHASILHDSEALRAEHPGIERFKIAAQKNSTNWCNAYAKFLPAPGVGVVQIYDPATKGFVDHPESDVDDDTIVDVFGPFAYFLSVVNVDRLEPKFRIAPLQVDVPPQEPTYDVIVIRPLRGGVEMDTAEARELFVPNLWKAVTAAYENGAHVDLRYQEDGSVGIEGDGPTVIEYVRCGGWEWTPDDIDEGAHLLCSDGAISVIEKGGRALSTAASPVEPGGFQVYV